jgi:hypothetical protein
MKALLAFMPESKPRGAPGIVALNGSLRIGGGRRPRVTGLMAGTFPFASDGHRRAPRHPVGYTS